MSRQRQQTILTLLAVLVAAEAAGLGSQEAAGLPAWLDAVQPEIERVLGYPLPQVRLETANGAAPHSRNVEAHLRLRFPHLDAKTYPHARADALLVNEQAELAQRVEGTVTLRVQPDNAARMTRWHTSLEAAGPDLVKLAVLHEVVRYALETRYDLAKRREACRDAEEWFALQALIEGRAQWLTRQLAAKLNLKESFPLLATRLLHVPDVSPDPALRTMSQSAQRQKHWAYSEGLAFWTALESANGLDEAKVFARPPRQTKWLEQPGLYVRALRAGRADLAAALTAVEAALPAAQWTAQPQPWTPDMVVQVAGLLGERARAEKVVQGWDEGRSLIWSGKAHPACMVALTVARFEAAGGARSYYGFAVDLQRKRDELSNTPGGLPLRVVESRTTSPVLAGVEEAVLFAKKIELPGSRQTIAAHTLLVRQAETVAEITWHDVAADTAWAQNVLRPLLAR